MIEYTTFLNAQLMFQKRFDRVSHKGHNLISLLPNPKTRRAHLIGGPRNTSGSVPAQTRAGIDAALKSAVRAERAVQERMASA